MDQGLPDPFDNDIRQNYLKAELIYIDMLNRNIEQRRILVDDQSNPQGKQI